MLPQKFCMALATPDRLRTFGHSVSSPTSSWLASAPSLLPQSPNKDLKTPNLNPLSPYAPAAEVDPLASTRAWSETVEVG